MIDAGKQADMRKTAAPKGSPAGLFAVLGIALALRLYQLGTESLWIDEGYSLRDATGSLSIFEARPLYFNILHWWMQLGQSEVWLRMPAVIFGGLTVLMVYAVGKRLFGETPALVAALLVAVSPLHVNHSQEVRMYSLLTFLVTMSVLLFIRFTERGNLGRLLPLLVVSFLSFLVFPLAVLMFATYTAYLLLHFSQHRKAALWWFASQAAMVVAIVPWIPKLVEVSREYGDAWTWRIAKPGILDLVWVTRDFNLWRIAGSHKTALLVANVYAVAVLGLALLGAVYWMKRAGWQTRLTLLWLCVPVAATAVISNVAANIWITRYMIYASPAFYLLIGLGLTRLAGSRALYASALTAVLLLPLGRLAVYYQQPEHPEWRQAVTYIESRLQPGDAIGLYRSGNKYVFHYYYDGDAPVVPLGEEGLTRQSFVGWDDARVASLLSAIPRTSRRVWFVFSYHEEAGGVEIESYVRRHYQVRSLTGFERVRIFEARPKGESARRMLLSSNQDQTP